MRVIKEFLGGILRPMKELADRLDRTEYRIAEATDWLFERVTEGQLPSISEEQAGLLLEFVFEVERFGGRLPIDLEAAHLGGWIAKGRPLKNRSLIVVYDYAFRHPRFLKFSGPGDDGREQIVAAIFARDPEELQQFLSSETGRLKYFPTTNMLVGVATRGSNETYRMLPSVYAPRGHEPMHVWVRADTL